ncbi:lytic transglycosylase domain-containing protein [Acetobacteraceae bacterium H6797]|nr:lytic transglycosylase domain-containing protein [Acetobacteraceae bacterium H6797]
MTSSRFVAPVALVAPHVATRGSRAVQGRMALALGLVALLAACGSQPRNVATGAGNSSGMVWNRPSSYNPPGPPSDPWGPYIKEASQRFDVPERWIREVMRQESGGRTSATSPVGAMGLMQVMPGTYAELRQRYGLGDDPYHPYDSIMAGTAYIREMYELYGSPGYLAAYNAGPRRFEDYLWNGKGLPAETRNYVARIGPRIADAHPNRRVAPEIYAAAEIPLNIPPGPRRMDSSTMLALREQRDALDPGIKVAQLPPGPVVRMDPIPDGSTTSLASAAPAPAPAPVQIASAGPIMAPGGVVRMDPIPDGSTRSARVQEESLAPPPGASARPVQMAAAAIPAPPPAMPSRLESAFGSANASQGTGVRAPAPLSPRPGVLGTANAAPGRLVPPSAPEPVQLASRQPSRGFSLIGTAHADTLPAAGVPRSATPVASSGSWAIQVGAFASENLARNAAGQAKQQVPVASSRTQVQSVSQGRNKLYRARVTGLSRESAQAACEKLRSRGACMVLSPDAQS